MPDFRIVIDAKDVALGDVLSLANDIWEDYAESFDATSGDFKLKIVKVNGDHAFDVDWKPDN
jgi:hypothetical protein